MPEEEDVKHCGTQNVYQVVAARTNKAEQEGRVIHLDGAQTQNGQSAAAINSTTVDDAAATTTLVDGSCYIGRRVRKRFEEGWFFGTVKHNVENVDTERGEPSYFILYDDGDTEEILWEDLESWMFLADKFRHLDPEAQIQQSTTTAAATTNKNNKRKADHPASPVRVKQEKGEEGNSAVVTPLKKKPPKEKPPRYNARTCKSDLKWVADMAKWVEHEKMSQSNGASIMRQVDKLAHGHGIGYKHWPDHVQFLPGQQVTLDFYFEPLMLDQAKRYEEKYGEDKGHGWLLRHPIRKLQLYQEYSGIEPTVAADFD